MVPKGPDCVQTKCLASLSLGAMQPKINRRTVVSSIASAGIATIGTIGLVHSGSEPASASVSMGSLEIEGDSAKTASGTIESVVASVSGNWSYEIQEGDPQDWQVVLQVLKDDKTAIVGGMTGSNSYMRYEDSFTVEGSITDTELYDPSDFAVTEDTETKEVEMSLKIWFQLFDGNENELATADIQDTATVSVTKDGYDASLYGEVSGEGGVEIVTESN